MRTRGAAGYPTVKGLCRHGTRLEDGFTAHAGDRHIRLEEPVSWKSGDEIIIVSTDFDPDQAERRTISSVSEDRRTVSFDEPLYFMHWGEIMEYAGHPVDQRAEVMHLSRNIVIQGDASSVEDNFGGHVMILSKHFHHMHELEMDDEAWAAMWEDPQFANTTSSMSRISGVELYRNGTNRPHGKVPHAFPHGRQCRRSLYRK